MEQSGTPTPLITPITSYSLTPPLSPPYPYNSQRVPIPPNPQNPIFSNKVVGITFLSNLPPKFAQSGDLFLKLVYLDPLLRTGKRNYAPVNTITWLRVASSIF